MGAAGTVAVEQISGEMIDYEINNWLKKHPLVEIIDIKFSTSATKDEYWTSDALIIYRRDN